MHALYSPWQLTVKSRICSCQSAGWLSAADACTSGRAEPIVVKNSALVDTSRGVPNSEGMCVAIDKDNRLTHGPHSRPTADLDLGLTQSIHEGHEGGTGHRGNRVDSLASPQTRRPRGITRGHEGDTQRPLVPRLFIQPSSWRALHVKRALKEDEGRGGGGREEGRNNCQT